MGNVSDEQVYIALGTNGIKLETEMTGAAVAAILPVFGTHWFAPCAIGNLHIGTAFRIVNGHGSDGRLRIHLMPEAFPDMVWVSLEGNRIGNVTRYATGDPAIFEVAEWKRVEQPEEASA